LCLLDVWTTLARGGRVVLVDPALAAHQRVVPLAPHPRTVDKEKPHPTRLVGPDMRLGSKTAGGQLVLVISDATGWTDIRECQTPAYAEGPCHCTHCDPRSRGLVAEDGAA
ncbi:hypothetical protein ACFCV9_36620, partial [Streptomyces sp. NPDC056367]